MFTDSHCNIVFPTHVGTSYSLKSFVEYDLVKKININLSLFLNCGALNLTC